MLIISHEDLPAARRSLDHAKSRRPELPVTLVLFGAPDELQRAESTLLG